MKGLGRFYAALQDRISGCRRAEKDIALQVSNRTRQTVLATCMDVADSGEKRRKGLLGQQGLRPGGGLWIIPCEAVHTFGMQFSIDLVYLDRKNRIKKLRTDVRPWRLSACLSARSVLELAAGTIQATQTKLGDRLEFSAAVLTNDTDEAFLTTRK
jgi:uncharacterized membrane protein (UPF0127 family)